MAGERHCGCEVQSSAFRSAIESLNEIRVMWILEATPNALRDPQSKTVRQRVHYEFPPSHIVFVAHAGKFGNPQLASRIDHTGFRTGAAERAAGRNQHAEPVFARGISVFFVAFQS